MFSTIRDLASRIGGCFQNEPPSPTVVKKKPPEEIISDQEIHSLIIEAYRRLINRGGLDVIRDDYLGNYDVCCQITNEAIFLFKERNPSIPFLPKELVKFAKLANTYVDSLKNGDQVP